MNFKKNIFFKNVSILFLGTLISQLINIGGLLILSRLYGTIEFAAFAVFTSIGLIVLSFSTFQLDMAIVKTKILEERLALMKLAFSSLFVITILVDIVLLIWAHLNPQINYNFIGIISFFFITNGGNKILVYFFNSEKKYQSIAIARVLLAFINIIIAIALFFFIPKAGLIIALTLANIFSFTCLAIFFGKKINTIFQISSSVTSKVLKENIQFLKFSTPSSFLDVLSKQIIVLFLANYFTEAITASFFMAMRIVLLPTGLIGGAISQVFYKDISDKFLKNKLTFFDFWKIWKTLALLGIIPFTLLFFFGKEIFEFALGEEWILAGEMGAILAITGFFTFLSSPTSSGFVVMNQQKYNLLNTIIRISYTLVFLILGLWKNDFFFFLWCFVIAEIVLVILYNFVMMKLLKE